MANYHHEATAYAAEPMNYNPRQMRASIADNCHPEATAYAAESMNYNPRQTRASIADVQPHRSGRQATDPYAQNNTARHEIETMPRDQSYMDEYTRNMSQHDDYSAPSAHTSLLGSFKSSTSRMTSLSKTKSPVLVEDQRIDLKQMGFPCGLAEELGKTRAVYPVRFWVLDNSGSMMQNDGTSIRGSISVQCTRWAELQETVNYHANLAGTLQATSVFRMLNDPGVRFGPQEFSIAEEGKNVIEEVQSIKKIMQRCKPFGSTPLASHLVEIGKLIRVTEAKMRKKGLEAVVIIATDGLPTSPEGYTSQAINNDFIHALQALQRLPVWVVIRLCTDEQAVVDFYNQLDGVLELPIEVLDDFFNEAKEIHKHNKWLNYAITLHRCREIGYQNRIFDLLDERPLNKDEVKEFCESLLGICYFENAPDVHSDWNGFLKLLTKVLKDEKPQFNPITKKMSPWIDLKELKKTFGGGMLGMFKRKT